MSPQRPLPSGFGAKTTTREVTGERRLDGTTAIVTGGYAGIGLETTRVLAAAGAHVIVPAREIAKATAALSGLANVTIDELDLGVPATIDAFAARFGVRPLHLLINNAGIMAAPLSRDARGLESQLAVNHVGHFQLFVLFLLLAVFVTPVKADRRFQNQEYVVAGFLDLADRFRDPVGLGKGIVDRVSQFLHELLQWLFHRVLPK